MEIKERSRGHKGWRGQPLLGRAASPRGEGWLAYPLAVQAPVAAFEARLAGARPFQPSLELNFKKALQAFRAAQTLYEGEGHRIERRYGQWSCRMVEGPLEGFLFVFHYIQGIKGLRVELWVPQLSTYRRLKLRGLQLAQSLSATTGFQIQLEVHHVF